MGEFHERAWNAAADAYGAARAEKWGKWARFLLLMKLVAIAVMVMGIAWACGGHWG